MQVSHRAEPRFEGPGASTLTPHPSSALFLHLPATCRAHLVPQVLKGHNVQKQHVHRPLGAQSLGRGRTQPGAYRNEHQCCDSGNTPAMPWALRLGSETPSQWECHRCSLKGEGRGVNLIQTGSHSLGRKELEALIYSTKTTLNDPLFLLM